jgi:hypothetical protein
MDAQTIINTTPTITISPRGSFKGYNFTTAVMRNKDLIKAELAVIGGLNLMPPFQWHTLILTGGVGLFVFVTKIAADAIDYFSSTVINK